MNKPLLQELTLEPDLFLMGQVLFHFPAQSCQSVMKFPHRLLISTDIRIFQPFGDPDLDAVRLPSFPCLEKIGETPIFPPDPGKRKHPADPGPERMNRAFSVFLQEDTLLLLPFLYGKTGKDDAVNDTQRDQGTAKQSFKRVIQTFFQHPDIPGIQCNGFRPVGTALAAAVAVTAPKPGHIGRCHQFIR